MQKRDSDVQFVQGSQCDTPIDIIVPTYHTEEMLQNKLQLTMSCIDALYRNTTAPFHLIVVDSSTEKRLTPIYFEELQKQHDNLTFIHIDKAVEGNQWFNIAYKHCKTPYIASVVNSLRVEPEWEIVALDLMKKDPKIGIVGLKCLFAKDCPGDGKIESAGITMVGYTPVDIGKGLESYRCTAIYECPAVQWAFALLRLVAVKDNTPEGIFNGHRGWDDIDNCFVVRKAGWKVIYCGYGLGYHLPRATRGRDDIEAQQANLQNAKIFYKRWGYWDQYVKDSKERFNLKTSKNGKGKGKS